MTNQFMGQRALIIANWIENLTVQIRLKVNLSLDAIGVGEVHRNARNNFDRTEFLLYCYFAK